jgi:nucleoside-diphosphate-sugar epimerase
MGNRLGKDLNYILESNRELWEELRGNKIFITGGTGFFGCWLLESFAWANDRIGLNAKAVVLTRNREAFRNKAPHLASHPAIQFYQGDVRNFVFPEGHFPHIIHAATEASSRLNEEDPLLMLDVIIQGTRHTLDFAHHCGTKNFLFISSGAVYGKQPSDLTHIPETYSGGPDTMDTNYTYAEGKRLAELLCTIYAKKHGIESKIARCFAFVGPYLPLDIHFAIGNFIRDALTGGPIIVKGDGCPYRSYLYAADLAIWLWTILFKGRSCEPYNVGSDIDMTIKDVAKVVAGCFDPEPVIRILKEPASHQPVQRYAPSIEKVKKELDLVPGISLPEAIKRTVSSISSVVL